MRRGRCAAWCCGWRGGGTACGPGDLAFGHARDQAAMFYGFVFVRVVETVGLAVLLRDFPALHAITLVIDVYGVVLMLGIHAASVTRPHVLSADALRVRHGAHRDLRIPLHLIASASGEWRFTHEAADGVIDIPVASRTSLTLELTEPVTAVGSLGGGRPVTTVRLHADGPAKLLAAVRRALPEALPQSLSLSQPLTQGLTQARTAPSPSQGPPA
ncbi:hypothetical protein AB0E78_03135 [Streptomyces sp. NPDC032198]|uniref:hypothetical protein n=1 Tax=Streptomyces sp. NPDC032198 TaxID=3155127 RepID=UPI0033DC9826